MFNRPRRENQNQQNSVGDAGIPPAPPRSSASSGAGAANGSFSVSAPALSLPKGGGAIRGIGEKFAANPVTGTASLSVPIAATSGRSGFSPQLSLSYDSGSGNGPFGFGWSLSLPSITRKTDKGLPKYRDVEESDVFILSGAEDLVPVLKPDGAIDENLLDGYRIRKYRPRIEGLFARIERWTRLSGGATHWRSISKDNITTLYGKTDDSRIADPTDPSRVFGWLICQSYDDKGNDIIYEYEKENSQGVDLSEVHERNRTEQSRSSNRYIKRIKYGNATSLLAKSPIIPPLGPDLSQMTWLFEVVFDYGEGHYVELPPDTQQRQFILANLQTPTNQWPVRHDPFSTYRSGFEVRFYRLCRRVLMFHHFSQELEINDYLVRSTEFNYTESPIASFITGVTQSGYVHQPEQNRLNRYLKKSLPPLQFEYTEARVDDEVHEIEAESLENLPIGLDGAHYQWVDLDGEGLSGILSEQADGWFYKPNLGEGRFGPVQVVVSQPSLANLNGGRQQLMDLAGDGQVDLVQFDGSPSGFFERGLEGGWENFVPFTSLPNLDWSDPNLKFVDLTGDGHADILVTEDSVFTWYPSLAEEGFGQAEWTRQALDEERGPRLVFADGTQSIYLAGISGDGLTDLVCIRNGEVCYWPNLGYGRFGPKVTMDNAPWFDRPDQFDHRRLRLADIDGSGTTDIIYLGRDDICLYFNQSGNGWAAPTRLDHFPRVDNLSSVMAADLLGNGTACLVWSSPLAGDARRPMRYIDLMGGHKPHLLASYKNNLGLEVKLEYRSSTYFYLDDKKAGKPWVTRLPFPVHCLARVTTTDNWRQTSFSTQYTYHHGYFDGAEREFRGFGRVEQVDVESFGQFAAGNVASPYITQDKTLYQPPVKTITWFHTGAFLDRERILSHYQEEYFPNWLGAAGFTIDPGYAFAERALPEPDLIELGLSAEEWREALRACKGMTLRQEVYELDVDALEAGQYKLVKLFTAACHNCQILRLQPRADNKHAVFLVTESEALTYHYELDLRESLVRPDPRIAHTLNLRSNEYGQPLQAVAVAYPRVRPFTEETPTLPEGTEALIHQVQAELHLSYTETLYTNDINTGDSYRLRVPCEVSAYELTGIRPQDEGDRATTDPWDDVYFTLDELRVYRLSEEYQTDGIAVEAIPYHLLPNQNDPQKRIVERARTLYFADNLRDSLPFKTQNALGLRYEAYMLALTNELLDAILREKLDSVREVGEGYDDAVRRILKEGGYHEWDSQWWVRSGIAGFAPDAGQHFYLPERYIDPFDKVTTLEYDIYDLYIKSSRDPVGNETSIERFDFRVMAPALMKDLNDNFTAVAFDTLGMPVASAIMGKNQSESGDHLAAVTTDLSFSEVEAFFTGNDYDEAKARVWLGDATARFVYYFGERVENGALTYGHHPACACGIVREKHVSQQADGPIRTAFEYSDGTGQVLVTKAEAEPETPGGPLQWLANGKTILNNKGKPVKQYEPYFSESGQRFEEPQEVGVTPVMYYDAVGRLVRTELPNGAYSRVDFSPWFAASYDANDTVLEPGNAWYALNRSATATAEAHRAAQLTVIHAATPAVTHLDSLGREVVAVAHNRYKNRAGVLVDEKYVTYTKLDAEGKPLWIRDARHNRVMQYIVPPIPPDKRDDEWMNYSPCYDIAGNLLYQHSMDAGDRWILNDITGKPLYAWDNRSNILRTAYEDLRRPKTLELRNDQHSDWIIVGYTKYGEGVPDDKANNLRGQPYQGYDQSGVITNVKFDLQGNLLEVRRRLASDYDQDTNWAPAITVPPDVEPLLMPEIFIQITEYDALNRPTRVLTPHNAAIPASEILPIYNEADLLNAIHVKVRGAANATEFVKNIDYNAKGQRTKVEYSAGKFWTSYEYDRETFRLTRLWTLRENGFETIKRQVQDLRYTYDPMGNITAIRDEAQQVIFFDNLTVLPGSDYTYDALYRLVEATGREHAAQNNVQRDDVDFVPLIVIPHPNSPEALQPYTEYYVYDEVGNVKEMHHTGGHVDRWTRVYTYAADSNRLLRTSPPGGKTYEDYQYNPHGSMTKMPHLQWMDWDFKDQLHISQRQHTTIAQPELTYYVYDSSGQRVRKVTKNANGARTKERLYLGGFEIYREYNGAGGGPKLERETLHIIDDKQRIALVETRTQGNDGSLAQLIRYQIGNHLGSAVLELDIDGAVITYEEYHPYGTIAYQAGRSKVELSLKRYRYTGMERDESGLSYHTARYYISWLGRWCSTDPLGTAGGGNLYSYSNTPTVKIDTSGTDDEEFMRSATAIAGLFHNESVFRTFYVRSHEYRDPIAIVEIGEFARTKFLGHRNAMGARRVAAYFDRALPGSRFNFSEETRALSLVIAFRESAQLARGGRPRDSNSDKVVEIAGHRYVRNFRGSGLDSIRRDQVSRYVGNVDERIRDDPDTPGSYLISQRHILTIFNAYIQHLQDTFFRGTDLSGLDRVNRLFWIALTFGGPGGTDWTTSRREDRPGRNTLLTLMNLLGMGLNQVQSLWDTSFIEHRLSEISDRNTLSMLARIDPSSAQSRGLTLDQLRATALTQIQEGLSHTRFNIAIKTASTAEALLREREGSRR